MTRSRMALLISTVLILVLVGACGTQPTAPETDDTTADQPDAEDDGTPDEDAGVAEPDVEDDDAETDAPAEVPRVGLLMPGVKNDLAWNQAAYEGLQSLHEQGEIELDYTEQVGYAAEDAARFARLYAEQGYDLIIAHNSGYRSGILEVAEEFPDVDFLYQDDGDPQTAENVSGYNMEIYQGTYLAGIIAGAASESGQLGGVGGMAIPFCYAYFNAFLDGARSVNPDASLSTVYVGDWGDIAGAQASAETLADRGADVLIACGDGPARGTVNAAGARGLSTFGYMHEMDVLAPNNIYGSVVWNAEESYRMAVEDYVAGTFRPGKHYAFDLPSGTITLTVNPNLQDAIPEDALNQLEEAQRDAADGTLEVPFDGEEI